mmetsp:Transcript_18406/g.46539  ORF Transcript_18406/g.46539 Transcript_18406/m.46539 type:complete len:205 (-) Transcript_18406:252-866(-)
MLPSSLWVSLPAPELPSCRLSSHTISSAPSSSSSSPSSSIASSTACSLCCCQLRATSAACAGSRASQAATGWPGCAHPAAARQMVRPQAAARGGATALPTMRKSWWWERLYALRARLSALSRAPSSPRTHAPLQLPGSSPSSRDTCSSILLTSSLVHRQCWPRALLALAALLLTPPPPFRQPIACLLRSSRAPVVVSMLDVPTQ